MTDTPLGAGVTDCEALAALSPIRAGRPAARGAERSAQVEEPDATSSCSSKRLVARQNDPSTRGR
jgi:hypothetical protein